MATFTNKRNVLSVEGKVTVIREIENGNKEKVDRVGIWYRKFYDLNALGIVRSCHSALRVVGQEPKPSQATDMALTCCLLGKVLGVGCHYFPPPLGIPTFAAGYLQVCKTREYCPVI